MHCCLANFYIDNFGYQENYLTKHHKLIGHKVKIVASTENYSKKQKIIYEKPKKYINENEIEVSRIPYFKLIPHFIGKKLRIYSGLSKELFEFAPDIIFIHGVQFLGVIDIVRYAKINPMVKIYVDSHTDFINSGKNFWSKNILHKIIYRWCAKMIEPYVEKFYGVTPSRVEFLNKVYKVDEKKIELLVMGFDDSCIDFSAREIIRKNVRKKLKLSSGDFVIFTGGKIDYRKNIHVLMEAVREIEKTDIKLIIVGQPVPELNKKFFELAKSDKIFIVGWISPDSIHEYIFASDLGVFPGTHSVLWEQVVGLGLPSIFKKWHGFDHVDVGGNCLFIDKDGCGEIKNLILKVYDDKNLFISMKKNSLDKGYAMFSYSKIAKKSIEN